MSRRAAPGLVALVAGLAVMAGAATSAWAQADLDAGLADGGGLGPDASARILIDGPTMLGIGRPQVSASAAPSEVRLGDKLTLFIEVTYDDQVTVTVPAGLDLQPVFDELKRSSVDERRSDGTRKRTFQLQLQVWEVGDLRIPPIQVAYTIGGESSWVVTNDVPIRVVATIDAIDDPNALLGATPPIGLRRRDWRWIGAGAALAIMAIGGLGAWLVARHRRRRRASVEGRAVDAPAAIEADAGGGHDPAQARAAVAPTPAPVATFSPQLVVVTHELRRRLGDAARRALDALDALERAGVLVTDPAEGHRRLVAIVHAFGVEHHRLPMRHRTTADFVAALRRTPMAPAAVAGATQLLARCDRVKFAGEHLVDDGAGALAEARAWVVLAASPRGAEAHA